MIMDTILRDAHQSQAATRMKIEEMIPILPVLDSIGYWSLERWGGATFAVCLRFLNEANIMLATFSVAEDLLCNFVEHK